MSMNMEVCVVPYGVYGLAHQYKLSARNRERDLTLKDLQQIHLCSYAAHSHTVCSAVALQSVNNMQNIFVQLCTVNTMNHYAVDKYMIFCMSAAIYYTCNAHTVHKTNSALLRVQQDSDLKHTSTSTSKR